MSHFIKAESGLYHSVIYTDDSGKHFRFSGGTWAWRNHNPGNIRPGKISKRNNQIGIVYNFAVFPDYESGHKALLDALHTTFSNMSIDQMMAQFAPPSENNTAKYRKFLHETTGVMDNKKIKNFTDTEFEKLWQGIEQIEGSKEGTIIEIYQINQVRKNNNGVICEYCIDLSKWLSKEETIDFAKQKIVELEVCTLPSTIYLRAKANSTFQPNLEDIVEKKSKGEL
jgi:hypothetical protein